MICKIEQLPFFQEYQKEELNYFAKSIDLLVNDESPRSFRSFLHYARDDLKQFYSVLEFTNKNKENIMDLVTFSKLEEFDRGVIKGSDVYSAIIRYKNTDEIEDYLQVIETILKNKQLPSNAKKLGKFRKFTKYLCTYFNT